MPGIAEKAMLVNLSVQTWSTNIHDKDVSRDVAARNHAGFPDAGKFMKRLLPMKAVKDITFYANQARKTHYHLTMPWDDAGHRVLPVTRFKEYKDTMDDLIDKRLDARNAFLKEYPAHISEARTNLGNLFNPDDYPDATALVSKISMEYHFSVVPDVNHFQAQLGFEETEAIRADIEEQINNRTSAAIADLYLRLQTMVNHCASKLDVDPLDPDAKQKKFRKNMVEDMQNILKVIPDLNIVQDQQLNDLCFEAMESLEGVSTDNLKKASKEYDAEKFDSVKQTMDDMSVKLAGYFGDAGESLEDILAGS